MANELSVELCYDDIRAAMIKFGFYIEVSNAFSFTSGMTKIGSNDERFCVNELISLLQMEKESVQTTYTENDRSMLRYLYDCVFFVARKLKDTYCDDQDDPPAAKSQRLQSTGSLT